MFLSNTSYSQKGELDRTILTHTVTAIISLVPGFHPIVSAEGDMVAF